MSSVKSLSTPYPYFRAACRSFGQKLDKLGLFFAFS
jgi:hypothetical protein